MTETEQMDVLAVGAHPDDVEWGCGGLVASQAALGRRVGILILTRGEAGTRGDAERRKTEALAGAERLGAARVDFLDCGDGSLNTDSAREEQVMFFMRKLRPNVVLAPPLHDRHPDHERAGALVRAASFYSGLIRRAARDPQGEPVSGESLPPFRPSTLVHYMLHDPFDPDVIVDCSSQWSKKIAALAAHESQFPAANGGGAAPAGVGVDEGATWISKRSFWDAIEGRARHYGQRIGVEFAEPFLTGGPLGLNAEQFGQLYLDSSG